MTHLRWDMRSSFESGLFAGFTFAVLTHFALQSIPVGCEAFASSLLALPAAIANFCSDWIGSYLGTTWRWSWNSLVWIHSGSMLLALLFVPYFLKDLMNTRDRRNPNVASLGANPSR